MPPHIPQAPPRSRRLDAPLVRFALAAFVLYAVWFAVYEGWIGPDGRLDAALSHLVARGAAVVLAALGYAPTVLGDKVWATPQAGAWVVEGCNGLSTLALFTGFVLAYPGAWRRRAVFLPLGAAFVFGVNVLRVAAIVVVLDRAPGSFGWVHALGAPHVFYATVFLLWVLWARYGGSPGAAAGAEVPARAPVPQPA